MSEKFRCPRCGYPYYCGCKACTERLERGNLPLIPRNDIDGWQCPICGFAQSMDGWIAIYEKQFPHWMTTGRKNGVS